jgi:hypothetical protein
MNKQETQTQATLGTRYRRGNQEWTIQRHRQHWALSTEGAIKNRQSRDQATLGTRQRRGNKKWTIQRHRQHWALDTEGEFKNGQLRDTDTGNIGH